MGAYVLIINLRRDCRISIGRLGKIKFSKGYYAYVGSAMKNLKKRVERHLSKNKKLFWHIDYLLAHENSEIVAYSVIESRKRIECDIAGKFAENFKPIKNFGSSDCRCRAHLFYLGKEAE